MKFTQLVDKYKYPPKYRAVIYEYFIYLFEYICAHHKGTNSWCNKCRRAFNLVVYYILRDGRLPDSWNLDDPFNTMPQIPDITLKDSLNALYLDVSDIQWDIEIVEDSDVEVEQNVQTSTKASQTSAKPVKVEVEILDEIKSSNITQPEDVYLQGPIIPRFDVNSIYATKKVDSETFTIYDAFPSVPTRQCEINITTDVNKMTDKELLNLFPNQFIYTRPAALYSEIPGWDYDEKLGAIPKILGFSKKQIIENIVKYPHLENIIRKGYIDGKEAYVEFWKYIEINGKLYKTTEKWDSLPDTQKIPRTKTVVEEYVLRRYLLERDIQGVEHRYNMYGELSPFLTLFMPAKDYMKYVTLNSIDIARLCVNSRVNYYYSRNPMIRRMDADE